MQKVLLLSLVTSGLLLADGNWLKDSFENGKVEGQVRAAVIANSYDDKATLDDSAFSLGGKLHYETDESNNYGAGATFYTSNTLGLTPSNADEINGELLSSTKKGYSILGEAYVRAKLGDTTLKIGRQELDTPLVNSDDIRMVPNTFTGLVAINNSVKNLTLIGAYVTKMSGWESEGSAEKFVNIQEAAGVANDDGVPVVAGIYDGIEGLTLQFWDYYVTNVINAVYLEGGYEFNVNGIDLGLGVQYQTQSDIGDKLAGEKDANMFGINASVGFESGTTFTIAYNDGNEEGLIQAWGAAPMFTSYFDNLTPVNGTNAEAVAGGVEQDLANFGFEGGWIGAYIGTFQADGFDQDEIDIALSYEVDNIAIDAVAIFLEDNKAQEGYNGYLLRANYNF